MSSFFSKYPKINYDVFSDGSSFELTDISRAVIINTSRIADDSALYTYYSIQDGDRPDIISHKLYGDSSYYWTFFITNDTLRDGYYSSWPLSYLNFTKMIEHEYTKYSSLSCIPFLEPTVELNGTGKLDISLIPLSSQYLPYLNFVSVSEGTKYYSKFVRYDTLRHQCIISDIYKTIGTTKIDVIQREDFVDSTDHTFKIEWNDNLGESDTNASLKNEWISAIYEAIGKYDTIGMREHIDGKTTIADYVSSKILPIASPEFRWSDYANAAYEYISTDGRLLNAYEVLTNKNIVFPRITSFFEYETSLNDLKRMIRVIRPEFIVEFSERYFETINDVL